MLYMSKYLMRWFEFFFKLKQRIPYSVLKTTQTAFPRSGWSLPFQAGGREEDCFTKKGSPDSQATGHRRHQRCGWRIESSPVSRPVGWLPIRHHHGSIRRIWFHGWTGLGDLLGSVLSGSEKENHRRDRDSASSSLTPTAAHPLLSTVLSLCANCQGNEAVCSCTFPRRRRQ